MNIQLCDSCLTLGKLNRAVGLRTQISGTHHTILHLCPTHKTKKYWDKMHTEFKTYDKVAVHIHQTAKQNLGKLIPLSQQPDSEETFIKYN